MQTIIQMLSIVIFSFITMNYIKYIIKLHEKNMPMLLFIIFNISLSVIQIIIFMILIYKRIALQYRLAIHILLSIIVIALMVIGSYQLFQSTYSLKYIEEKPDEERNMLTHLNFTVSLMIWFRFIETFMCTCMYLGHVMNLCRRAVGLPVPNSSEQ